jgi:hypothetical protein
VTGVTGYTHGQTAKDLWMWRRITSFLSICADPAIGIDSMTSCPARPDRRCPDGRARSDWVRTFERTSGIKSLPSLDDPAGV